MNILLGQLVARFGIRRVRTCQGHLHLCHGSLLHAWKSAGKEAGASSPCHGYKIPHLQALQNPLHGL